MKLSKLYNTLVQLGRDKDPRKDKAGITFPDSAILFGEPHTEIKNILAGIDIEVPEILLADTLRKKSGIDLVISHHPEGKAYARFYEVMQLQVDMLSRVGVSRKIAQEFLEERKREVERRVLPANHTRAVDAARLLDIPFMCMHTPADNHVSSFIYKLLRKADPRRLEDIIDLLEDVPEYSQAKGISVGPRIIAGNPHRSAGKVFVEMTGGTEGHKDIYSKLYKKGIRTIVCMHLSEEHFKKVKDVNLNVVIAGHISSDSLGLNLLFDRLEEKERFNIIGCSGFNRIKRN